MHCTQVAGTGAARPGSPPLAMDRSDVGKERTLLAYLRTALAFAVVGGSLIRFFDSFGAKLAGWVFAAAAVVVALIGGQRFTVRRTRIRHTQATLPKSSDANHS